MDVLRIDCDLEPMLLRSNILQEEVCELLVMYEANTNKNEKMTHGHGVHPTPSIQTSKKDQAKVHTTWA
jgi:hypothetical protein